ncbi:unnamed protein product [Euphydryas editha]|uniref:Nucleic-acid-binding protein from mobile element jockey n=1 Tax=Euphydryas editha TaxID=104508 RepID=A0AAU9UDU0_EUPED|nr:unnamed protein product [Euphydryas editha]
MELVESLELPFGYGEVVKARCLNRKSITERTINWVPTQSVVLTFKRQLLSEKNYSYHTSLPVETYKFPAIQCLNCCPYGHIKTQCRSKPRCFECSKPHTGESCDVVEDKASCLHCSGKHFTTNKTCPEFSRQQSIKCIMSLKIISYFDVSSRIPPANRSYAAVAKAGRSLQVY